jgi:trigger factor
VTGGAGDEPGLGALGRSAPESCHGITHGLGHAIVTPMAAVKTTTKELGDSRVRVSVEVPSEALESELRSAASALGREMRVPGFRKGKVPPQVVIQQVGREALLDEAVRRALPGWYEEALADAEVSTVGDPEIDLSDLPERGAPLSFTIEVGVRPKARLGQYKGVEVGKREPEVDPDKVEAELGRLRDSLASLETVEWEAAEGDFVVLDFTGTVEGEAPDPERAGAGGSGTPVREARGFLLELGSGRPVPGFDRQLIGAKAGETREVRVTLPDDYPEDELAGKEAAFTVEVKEVKEKRLPDLDDDFALEAGGYDSLDELRAEIEARLREIEERRVEAELREAAVDSVAAEAKVEIPHELVHVKAHEMWHRTARRLADQGVDPERYLEITGKTEEELVSEAEPDAERALRRESVLAAIVEEEGIEVTDEELLDALKQATTGRDRPEPSEKALRRSLKRAKAQGADEALREDIAMRKAVDLVVEHAKPIPVEQAKAREKLWTPEKEKGAAGQIWTPGSSR